MSNIAQSSHAAPMHPASQATPTFKPASTRGLSRSDRRRWKLTRRGRFIFRRLPLLTVAALIVLGAIALINPPEAQAGNSSPASSVTQEVAVRGGETLWDIALQVETEEDTRDVIQHIIELNDLSSTTIDAGQRLEIPLYSEK